MKCWACPNPATRCGDLIETAPEQRKCLLPFCEECWPKWAEALAEVPLPSAS